MECVHCAGIGFVCDTCGLPFEGSWLVCTICRPCQDFCPNDFCRPEHNRLKHPEKYAAETRVVDNVKQELPI